MTLHEIISKQGDEWCDKVVNLYSIAAFKWCTDEATPSGLRRRVAVARRSLGSRLCVGFFIVLYKPDKEGKAGDFAVIEESSVYDPPRKADELDGFVRRELFKASLANVRGVIGATFKGGTEIVKHYESSDGMVKDLAKL